MNILVTGGCGFIGSNFINYMVKKYPDYKFINLDVLYYCASLDNINVDKYNNYKFVKGNINDYNLIVFFQKTYESILVHSINYNYIFLVNLWVCITASHHFGRTCIIAYSLRCTTCIV